MVVGRERSGTKWLTNLIANHPEISCVQAVIHGGVLETNLLDRMESVFGSFAIKENRIGFNHCMQQTVFYKQTGLPISFIEHGNFNDPVDFFVQMMDQYAVNNNSTGWVQKANSLLAEKLRSRIPDVKIIAIHRNPIDNLVSTSKTSLIDFRYRNIGRMMAGYVYAQKYEEKFCRKHGISKIKFENLKSDRIETMRHVFDVIGYDFDDSMLVDRFEKNSSFKKIKRPELKMAEKRKLQRLFKLLSLVPLPMLKFVRDRFGHGRLAPERFVSGTFTYDESPS